MDNLTKQQRSLNMSRIRSSGTEFEKGIFREIRRKGIKFQENYSRAPGKPDIALPRAKKAVFLHSDFWHGWQFSRWEKILPNDFWKWKIRKNRTRDKQVLRKLHRMGWDVMVVWEHQVKKNFEKATEDLRTFLSR